MCYRSACFPLSFHLTSSAHFWDASFAEHFISTHNINCLRCSLYFATQKAFPASFIAQHSTPRFHIKMNGEHGASHTRRLRIPSIWNYQWKWSLHTRSHTFDRRPPPPCVHENSIKTLIIWENLRNCVLDVTFSLFLRLFLFLIHAKLEVIAGYVDNVFCPTRYGFLTTTRAQRIWR